MGDKSIVIVGAGFAGVRAALELYRNTPNCQISLINDTPYHVFHADLYQLVSVSVPNPTKLEFKHVSGTTNIPLKQIFRKKPIQILVDKVKGVDLQRNIVNFGENNSLKYDYLVLALGSTTNYYKIEGAADFSHSFKTTEDALNIRNDIEERLVGLKKPLSVLIIGGGMTGVELAGELAGHYKNRVQIDILEGGPEILPDIDKDTQAKALKKLKKLNIQIKTNHLIQKVDEVMVYCQDDKAISYDYLVWTAGISGTKLPDGIVGTVPNKKGQYDVQRDLSLENYPSVFVAGDLASFFDTKRNCYIAATAMVAIEQGELAAKNINYQIQGKPTQSYSLSTPVFAIPIGPMFALSNAFNLSLQGKIGWFLKRIIALKYMLSILPPFLAITTWWNGVVISLNESYPQKSSAY